MKTIKSISGLLISTLFITSVVLVSSASAYGEYYYNDPNFNNYNYTNYNYQQPYGVTTFNGSYSGCGYSNCQNYTNYNSNYNYNPSYLTPVTYAATNVTPNRGTINGYVTLSGGNYNTYDSSAWFEYGTNSNYLNYTTNPATIYSSTSINSNLTNLSCGQIYYYRAVSRGQNGTQYGSTLSFYTPSCYNYSNYIPNNYYQNSIPRNIPTNCAYKNTVRRYR